MKFTENDKLKALAIVNIFETSQPFGDHAACVVLNDGAGISYGINQFTHRSGSLAAVVEAYLRNGGQLGKEIFAAALPVLCRTSTAAINNLSRNTNFRNALRAAAITREMKAAQQEIAFEKYLLPALQICEARGFVLPLSLAVVYDSLTHGSFERISRTVGDLHSDEKAWITEYVRKRHLWLYSIQRLRPTAYRTKFFLNQIAISNWNLSLPLAVHGFKLTEAYFPVNHSVSEPEKTATGSTDEKGILASAGDAITSAAEKFDRVSNAVTTSTTRRDAAKSLWTTVVGTIWQVMWAIFGFVAGLPREVWIVVALIAAALMLAYLYRQIELGRIREQRSLLRT